MVGWLQISYHLFLVLSVFYNRTKHDLPFGLCMLLTATLFPSWRTSLHHSYQTLSSSHLLHILHMILDPGGANCGSRRGKYRGNQLNIPTEKVVGAILIIDDFLSTAASVMLSYNTQWNVPKKPWTVFPFIKVSSPSIMEGTTSDLTRLLYSRYPDPYSIPLSLSMTNTAWADLSLSTSMDASQIPKPSLRTGWENSQHGNSLWSWDAAWVRTTYGVSIACNTPHGFPPGPVEGGDRIDNK